MSANQTIHPTQTLANDSRAQLEPWLEEFETHARNLCAQHDATGALTLVASDDVWNSIPATFALALMGVLAISNQSLLSHSCLQ